MLSKALFPGLLQQSQDLLLLRSIQSWEAVHERGQFYLQTAHPANPAFIAESPNMGSIIGLEKGGVGLLPPFLSLNGAPDQGAKFLGGKVEPMSAPANSGGLATLTSPVTDRRYPLDALWRMRRCASSAKRSRSWLPTARLPRRTPPS